ncbi:MAG: hypothetical protein ACOYK9_05120 [Chlamydiia bacterium]
MQVIDNFFETHKKRTTNIVAAFYNKMKVAEFSSNDPILDTIIFLNGLLKNFRLTGVTIATIFEPTLKEMGALTLSRVDQVLYLKKHPLSAPPIWDHFLVHRVILRQYAASAPENR